MGGFYWYDIYRVGGFSEQGMFENAIRRSEDAPILNDVPLWIDLFLIKKLMFDMFRMYVRS